MTRAEREAVFGYVYENNRWGRSPDGRKYYSDSPPELTEPYRRYVSAFIQDHAIMDTRQRSPSGSSGHADVLAVLPKL